MGPLRSMERVADATGTRFHNPDPLEVEAVNRPRRQFQGSLIDHGVPPPAGGASAPPLLLTQRQLVIISVIGVPKSAGEWARSGPKEVGGPQIDAVATSALRTVGAEFWARHSIAELSAKTEDWLATRAG